MGSRELHAFCDVFCVRRGILQVGFSVAPNHQQLQLFVSNRLPICRGCTSPESISSDVARRNDKIHNVRLPILITCRARRRGGLPLVRGLRAPRARPCGRGRRGGDDRRGRGPVFRGLAALLRACAAKLSAQATLPPTNLTEPPAGILRASWPVLGFADCFGGVR